MKKLLAFLFVIIFGIGVVLMVGPTAIGETNVNHIWPMFHHDAQHSGKSQNLGPLDNTLLWTFDGMSDKIYSSPVIDVNGIIYVGSEDSHLYAINPDGTLKWTFDTEGGIYSSPAIGMDGTVYMGSRDNYVYAINQDGTLKWKYLTGSEVNSSPAIANDGTIYIGSYDRHLYSISSDGSLKWKYCAVGWIHSSSPAIGPDGIIYVGSMNENRLHAINPDGTLKWKSDPPHINVIQTSPTLSTDGSVVYYGADDGYLYARNTSDGSLKWASPWSYGGIQSSPAIGNDGTVYVGTQYGNLWAVDPEDGSLKWDYYTTLSAWSSPAVGADGTVYFATDYGHIYAMNQDGSVKWIYDGNFANDGNFRSSPAIGNDGTLYIGSTHGKLYAFSMSVFGYIEDEISSIASFIINLNLELFTGPNDNANQGRRKALSNKANAAANKVASGNALEAINVLNNMLSFVDGIEPPLDWIKSSEEKDEIVRKVNEMIELLELLL